MGSPYQSQSASGYNSSPPPDDGSTTASNKITWASIKSKLADSVKTLADAINTSLRSALNVTPSTTSTNYTTLVSDHQTTIEVSGTTTISLGDAATMIAQSMGYTVTVLNKGTNTVTTNLASSGNTLNGTANGTTTIPPWSAATFTVNQAGTGYEIIGSSSPSAIGGPQTLTDGATVNWNLNGGVVGQWTIGGNRTLANPTNISAGGRYLLQITQDGTGGRTVTWGSKYLGVNGSTQPPQPNPTAAAITEYYFSSPDGSNLYLVASPTIAFGQCYLSKSSTNLLLSRKDGTLLTINGKAEVIPDAGVTLGVGGLSASTAYFIYAFMSAGVMTLEAVATTHATQAGTGIEIKSGDATRTLVGWGRTNGSTAWQDDNTSYIGVLSYFNRRVKGATNAGGATGTASTSVVELGGRINYGTWADELVLISAFGTVNNSTGNTATTMGPGTDTTSGFDVSTFFNNSGVSGIGATHVPWAASLMKSASEGFHFSTINEQVTSGSATNTVTTLSVSVRG